VVTQAKPTHLISDAYKDRLMRKDGIVAKANRFVHTLLGIVAASLLVLPPAIFVVTNSAAYAQFAKPLERTTVYVYLNEFGSKDKETEKPLVLTIRPSTLSTAQVADLNAILGLNMLSGQRVARAYATRHQLELIQSVLAPSASDTTLGLATYRGSRKAIDSDPSAAQWTKLRRPGDDPRYIYEGPLPTAKKFARFFVIVGVVCATILWVLAAFSIVTGQLNGSKRIIGTAAGLVLLLMGYTIYKIMVMNSISATSVITPLTISRSLPYHGLASQDARQVSDTPRVPEFVPVGALRSGRPVQPLAGASQ